MVRWRVVDRMCASVSAWRLSVCVYKPDLEVVKEHAGEQKSAKPTNLVPHSCMKTITLRCGRRRLVLFSTRCFGLAWPVAAVAEEQDTRDRPPAPAAPISSSIRAIPSSTMTRPIASLTHLPSGRAIRSGNSANCSCTGLLTEEDGWFSAAAEHANGPWELVSIHDRRRLRRGPARVLTMRAQALALELCLPKRAAAAVTLQ